MLNIDYLSVTELNSLYFVLATHSMGQVTMRRKKVLPAMLSRKEFIIDYEISHTILGRVEEREIEGFLNSPFQSYTVGMSF